MPLRYATLVMTLVLSLAPAVYASGKKENQAAVTFHMETDDSDNEKMIVPLVVNGVQRVFRRMPELTIKDVQSFNPFPSDAGNADYGVIFKLKDNAARRYAAVTNINQGRWMVAQVNGRVVDAVIIDKQVDDGVVVVWKNITLADIKIFDDALPRFGQDVPNNKK